MTAGKRFLKAHYRQQTSFNPAVESFLETNISGFWISYRGSTDRTTKDAGAELFLQLPLPDLNYSPFQIHASHQ